MNSIIIYNFIVQNPKQHQINLSSFNIAPTFNYNLCVISLGNRYEDMNWFRKDSDDRITFQGFVTGNFLSSLVTDSCSDRILLGSWLILIV
jgi:hypothetical protein